MCSRFIKSKNSNWVQVLNEEIPTTPTGSMSVVPDKGVPEDIDLSGPVPSLAATWAQRENPLSLNQSIQ